MRNTSDDAAAIHGRGTLALPRELDERIEKALATVPAAQWIGEAQALSQRYRGARDPEAQRLATGRKEALGYVALILPATYAQLRGAMAAAAARAPRWRPSTMLDLGSGPGTALWAAAAQWPSLENMTAWEREPAFIDLGRELARSGAPEAVRGARWTRYDLQQLGEGERQRYDLVVLGHVLNELLPEVQQSVVSAAWRMTTGLLLIVEPGTTAAFGVVRAARDQLLGAGASTLAPCAHDHPCPLAKGWCHFPQRIVRPEFQRRARGAPSPWEDSKYAYAAMARFAPSEPIWGRVIGEPFSNKAYAEVEISGQPGTARFRGLKRHREAFRQVRDLRWGETLSEPLPEPISAVDLAPVVEPPEARE